MCFRALVVTAFMAAGPAVGGYSSTSLIDVPASEYLDHMQYEVDLVLAVSADPAVTNYGDANLNLGLAGMSEVGLAVYSVWNRPALGAHFKVELIDEEHYNRYQPALSVGMDELTIGDGVISHAGDRFPSDTAAYDMDFRDNISPFVVTSKTVDPFGTFHLGWGYGRFVGAGPKSYHFHGVFMGFNRRVWRTFEILVEEDGRDINVGVRHTLPWLTVGTAIEKVEQLGSPSFHPFYALTLEFSPRLLHTGGERLEVRRDIRALEDRADFLTQRVGGEEEMIAGIRQRIYDLSEEYEGQGISPKNLDRVYAEIDDLEKSLETAEESVPVEKTTGDGGL